MDERLYLGRFKAWFFKHYPTLSKEVYDEMIKVDTNYFLDKYDKHMEKKSGRPKN